MLLLIVLTVLAIAAFGQALTVDSPFVVGTTSALVWTTRVFACGLSGRSRCA